MTYIQLPIDRVFLRKDNPRFIEPVKNEDEAIAKLCSEEGVLNLAKDISSIGLNPMDVAGVIKDKKGTYLTGEGNRRFCALKLLSNPERAPEKYREAFKRLSENSTHDFSKVMCFVFDDEDNMKEFIRRMHTNYKDVRRKRWSAEAQEKQFKIGKNALAVAVNKFADENGLYKNEEEKIDITTLQRWAGKPSMKALLGIEATKGEVNSFRSKTETKKVVKALLEEIRKDKNPSRQNKDHIEVIASGMQARLGLKEASSKGKRLSSVTKTRAKTTALAPSIKPPTVKQIAHDSELYKGFQKLGLVKIASLYFSLTNTRLKDNVPMLSVTLWSILECMTKAHGNVDGFKSYMSKNRLAGFGLCSTARRNNDYKKFDEALDRISRKGNATKHEILGGGFDALELFTDAAIITPILKAMVTELLVAKDNN